MGVVLIRVQQRQKNADYPGESGDYALGYSRGGYGTKIHFVCDGRGFPMKAEMSGGQCHESKYFEILAGGLSIKGCVGRPRKYPDKYAGDKGYSNRRIRCWLNKRSIEDVIPNEPLCSHFSSLVLLLRRP